MIIIIIIIIIIYQTPSGSGSCSREANLSSSIGSLSEVGDDKRLTAWSHADTSCSVCRSLVASSSSLASPYGTASVDAGSLLPRPELVADIVEPFHAASFDAVCTRTRRAVITFNCSARGVCSKVGACARIPKAPPPHLFPTQGSPGPPTAIGPLMRGSVTITT